MNTIQSIDDALAQVPVDTTNPLICLLRNTLIECRAELLLRRAAANNETVQLNAIAATSALARAITSTAEATQTSKQSVDRLRDEIKAHIECAQHHLGALFAELAK